MQTVGFFNQIEPSKSGGKGKNLVELVNASFPVPLGFVVSVDAYTLYRKSEEMPSEIRKQVLDHYRQLVQEAGSRLVAVRSSASAEDLDTASFAGQQDTYLYVNGEEGLLRRIVDCWNSLYTERAVAYRERMNIPDDNLKMAVIVQTMIDPKSAGVLFTVDPYLGNENLMIIESNWGCGESVVSGKVTPDHFEISKTGQHEIISKKLGEKDIVIYGGESGLLERNASAEQRNSYSLNDVELSDLCEIGRRIEHHYERPQDIEWAIGKDGKLYILQSRPITRFGKDTGSPLARIPAGSLFGLGANPGKAYGRAEIIDTSLRFGQDNILLAKYTNPSMVPVMIKAKAIATERGGMVSHAAIVSRELGLPCVVGVAGLLSQFKDGDYILVDGNNGFVSYANKSRTTETNLEDVSPKTGNLVYLIKNSVPVGKKDTSIALKDFDIDLDKALDLSVKGIARMFSKITYVDCFWPNPSNTGYSAFLGDYIKGLHRAISVVEEKGISAEDFAHLFKTPTCIYRTFVRIARAREHLSRDQRIYLSKRLLSAVDVLKSDEPFNGTSNRRMPELAVKEYVNTHNFLSMPNDGIRDKVGRLNFLLWNYAETLYWTRWSTGFDFEGPYRINEEQGDHMIIRDGFELRPVELWPQLKDFPYANMKVATVYRGVGDFQIDPYGHLTHSGNIRNAATFYHFFGETKDGQRLDTEMDIDEALTVFPSFIDRNASVIQSFNVRERVLKQAEIEWYLLRDVFRYAGIDWRPPLEVQQKIMSEDFKENLILLKGKQQTDEERYSHYLKALDPRLD